MMEALRLKPRAPVEEIVENWDDDDFLIEGEDLTFQSQPSASAGLAPSRRESHSSFRSDLESAFGDEEKHVHLPGNDEKSTLDAIAAAARAGIPIPRNVPPSALVGGTIKRLGGKKIKKALQEDWGDDLELPAPGHKLQIKLQDSSNFPDVVHFGNSANTSPTKVTKLAPSALPAIDRVYEKPVLRRSLINLDQFKDNDDDDFFGDEPAATFKLSSRRKEPPKPISLITPPTPQKKSEAEQAEALDDFETDFELPSDGKLKLSRQRDIPLNPRTPTLSAFDDLDWADGSLGTRFGGTRRDGRSNRSSSASALSPSIASSITAESEDDAFDGLVIPDGPVDFRHRLRRGRQSRSPERALEKPLKAVRMSPMPLDQLPQKSPSPPPEMSREPRSKSPTLLQRSPPKSPMVPQQSPPKSPRSTPKALQQSPFKSPQAAPKSPLGSPIRVSPRSSPVTHYKSPPKHVQGQMDQEKDDFLSGLEIGNGEIFTKKTGFNPHVQIKETRPSSSSRPKTTVALKFTNKPVAGTSRLPRPLGMVSHERTHTQSSLEPVSESGGPILQSNRRSLSRMGHSAHSSITSIGSAATPSPTQPFTPTTPRRHDLSQRASNVSLRKEPTTTSAQLLRMKRSLPVMNPPQSPARPLTSRGYERPPSRNDAASRPSSLRPKTPVDRPRVDSAASQARNPVPFVPPGAGQSHSIHQKNSRHPRRHDSDNSIDFRPNSRAFSRSTMRSPSPRKHRPFEKVASDGSWKQLSKPTRVQHFGDGHELDAFDDLPTSTHTEAKFTRTPSMSASKAQVRNKLYQNILPDRTGTPSPGSPFSPARSDYVPSFARDTAASRIARETSLAQRGAPNGPLAPVTSQRIAQLSSRSNLKPHSQASTRSKKKKAQPLQLKPHLISNLNPPKESKVVNGMLYNPDTMRWEGNDNALGAFEPPASSPSTASIPPFQRERENSTPRPHLIANLGVTKGVQVVGGMVFDPQNMCWLKLGPQTGQTEISDPMENFTGIEEDDDVFKDIPDLEDRTLNDGHGGSSDMKEDWFVGEEFDVGPEFVRRQRQEEERWRTKVGAWISESSKTSIRSSNARRDAQKWAIRDLVMQSMRD